MGGGGGRVVSEVVVGEEGRKEGRDGWK